MKVISLLIVAVLLLLFLNWKTERLEMQTSSIDLGPNIDASTIQSFFKTWSPDTDKIKKQEGFTPGKPLDLGSTIDFNKFINLTQNWEPDPKEFEKIQRKIDKKEDSRNSRKKAIACAIDQTQGGPLPTINFWGHLSPDTRTNPVWNIIKGNWNHEEWIKGGQCNFMLPVMNLSTAAMKCALDNDKYDDIVLMVERNLSASEYLQKKECQGYFTTDDMFF